MPRDVNEALERGTLLEWVAWGEDVTHDGDATQISRVGSRGVVSLEVGQEAGPTGYFATVVATRDDGRVMVSPLYKATSWEITSPVKIKEPPTS